jgi:aspartokinase/homoserine dehydrogenase 1
VLEKAQTMAMTEPDPREDLSGMDVARKLLILARQLGWQMELSDISVENLVPFELQGGPYSNQFFTDLEAYEDAFKQRLLKCKAENKVLRYIGILHDHKASAQLMEIPADHALALACHSDNIISFTTEHYHEMPLVIRGPGAGVECTALGVFSDILKLISVLPN